MGAEGRRVGVIGLGLMGTAIVERLLERGYVPVVWNRTREKADPFLARGAIWSDNPLVGCDRVIVSLYSSDVVDEVLGPRYRDVAPGTIVIDTTTGEPSQSELWAGRLAECSACYIDAPISGSSEQTRRGEATVMVGGDESAFRRCDDLWPVLGKNVYHVGPSGGAAKMKLITNLVLGVNRAALAEGLALAERMGIDGGKALEVLKGSAAYSRQMDTKGQKMLDRDYSVQARLSQHLKDVRLILAEAQRAGIETPLVDAHRRMLELAETLGWGDADNSAVIEALRKRAATE
jgi:3-hydroxyisobutyrate dehydrogenase-like beta-hydroxyacid dehydrogenase